MAVAGDGVTLCVGVHYEASSPRRIALRFQNAGFSDVHITSLTEALIAPAILPRGWLQQQILLAIKEVGFGPAASSLAISIVYTYVIYTHTHTLTLVYIQGAAW